MMRTDFKFKLKLLFLFESCDFSFSTFARIATWTEGELILVIQKAVEELFVRRRENTIGI